MEQVRTSLYLGDYLDSRNQKVLLEAGISHILSLYGTHHKGGATSGEGTDVFERMSVPVLDTEEENLLDHLDACIEFIQGGRQKGGVLVHCHAGVSRSAAVMTAYLMKTESLTLQEALAAVREVSPTASPNPGFIAQLKLFETMGGRVDPTNSKYKQFRMEQLGRAYYEGQAMEASQFAADPAAASGSTATCQSESAPRRSSHASEETSRTSTSMATETAVADALGRYAPCTTGPSSSADGTGSGQSEASGQSGGQGSDQQRRGVALYRCKKCRRAVVAPQNLLQHEVGEGAGAFGFRKDKSGSRGGGRSTAGTEGVDSCSSIFVEPMRWMTTVKRGEVEGKLACPKCAARLGSFNWSGMQCSCGAWVTPAFQLHKSKLDESWG